MKIKKLKKSEKKLFTFLKVFDIIIITNQKYKGKTLCSLSKTSTL